MNGVRLARRFIHDVRDLPFLKLIALATATVIPTGVLLFVPGMFRWWLAAVHLGLVLYLLGPFVLMLHNTSHRRLFKRPWSGLNHFIPWVLGPFFGESPETYFAHHVGMHHPENNVGPDISSTLDYQRDSLVDFGRYFFRFLLRGVVDLTRYFRQRRRHALTARTIAGELALYVVVLVLFFVEWRATLVGNWAQHAFVDRAAPANNYRNSITCINTSYNRRCFNDGYHIGHHLKATRHWTELPDEFARTTARYEAEGAVVFAGIDFFGVWVLLMAKRYDALARRCVQLGETQRSADEIIALLQSRTRWTRSAAAALGEREEPDDGVVQPSVRGEHVAAPERIAATVEVGQPDSA
jgi:fatty acid desaturase